MQYDYTTTPSAIGKQIDSYYGIVFGVIISGVDFIKDLSAESSNFFGGKSRSYEDELINARQQTIDEMA